MDNNGLWGRDYDPDLWDDDGSLTADDNEDGHPGDPGCSSPYDDTESMSWDTDLSAAYEGNSWQGSPTANRNPSVFFSGELKLGNDIGGGGSINGQSLGFSKVERVGGGDVVEQHLGVGASVLGEGKYSSSGLSSSPVDSSGGETDVMDQLPDGTLLIGSNYVVEPPVSTGQVSGAVSAKNGEVTCGNGDYDQQELSAELNSRVSQPSPDDWAGINVATDPAQSS